MRRHRIALVVAALLLAAPAAAGAQPPVLTFVLAGQSNMVGNGPLPATPLQAPHVTMLDLSGAWTAAVEPMQQGVADAPYATMGGAGAGIPFANDLIRDGYAADVRLIQCAVNGSPVAAWTPAGDLYRRCVERAEANGPVAGILFFQGEQEAISAAAAATWAASFEGFVGGVESTLGPVPVVFAQLGPSAAAANVNELYYDQVKAQQASVQLPNVSMIRTDDLTVYDGIHFETASYRTIGGRFAAALEPLLAASTAVVPIPAPPALMPTQPAVSQPVASPPTPPEPLTATPANDDRAQLGEPKNMTPFTNAVA